MCHRLTSFQAVIFFCGKFIFHSVDQQRASNFPNRGLLTVKSFPELIYYEKRKKYTYFEDFNILQEMVN